MVSIDEIIVNKYFAWCDKMLQAEFSGCAVCPANGKNYWFILGLVCDSYEEYEYQLNKFFGCNL